MVRGNNLGLTEYYVIGGEGLKAEVVEPMNNHPSTCPYPGLARPDDARRL